MSPEDSSGTAPPAAYGPFHRIESPTQTAEDARRQEESGEIWGRAPRWGGWERVKAYAGPLPPGARGIEFYTDAEPDVQGPHVSWALGQSRPGVRVEGDYAKISCVVVKNTQHRAGDDD